ncbi:MAG: hypothetical protein AAB546_03065 [Patescibacteria group bacterium]
MAQERRPEEDDLNFHCPVAEKDVTDLQDTREDELKCARSCHFYGKTGELCQLVRKEKSTGSGELTRETRYRIADKIAPHCIGPRKLGYIYQDRYAKNIG